MPIVKENIDRLINELRDINQEELDKPGYDREENIHRIFLYPAMMVPAVQRRVIEIICKYIPDNSYMIDPFMGSSTSILSCMEMGLNAYGQDINPLAVLLSKVKTATLDVDLLTERLTHILRRIHLSKITNISVEFEKIDKWFKKEAQIELSKIREAIISEPDIQVRRFYWIIMAETIRTGSNDRTSTYKLHQRPIEDINKRNISLIKEFEKLAKRSIKDVAKFKDKLKCLSLLKDNKFYNRDVIVKWGNSKTKIRSDKRFSLLVSSPPYGDNHTTVTYGQHSFLQLQWIPSKDIDCDIDYNYLKSSQEIDRVSLGGIINSAKLQEQKDYLKDRTPALINFLSVVPEEQNDKLPKIITFIYDFDKSLDRIIGALDKNAFLIWTIGNRNVAKKEVPNDTILKDLMSYREISLIYEVERNILNSTMPNKNKTSDTMSKEKILIFQKPY